MFFVNDLYFLLPECFLLLLCSFFLIDQVFLNENPLYRHAYNNRATLAYNRYCRFNVLFSLFGLLLILFYCPTGCFSVNYFCYASTNFLWFSKFGLIFLAFCFFSFLFYSNAGERFSYSFWEVEFITLFFLCLFGLFTLLSARDWLLIYLILEIYSLAAYALVAFKRFSIFSTEGGLKYFILGSISSAVLLLGFSFIYGFLGVTNLFDLELLVYSVSSLPEYALIGFGFGFILCLIAFGIKIAAAPFHYWAIDAYDGAPLAVT